MVAMTVVTTMTTMTAMTAMTLVVAVAGVVVLPPGTLVILGVAMCLWHGDSNPRGS